MILDLSAKFANVVRGLEDMHPYQIDKAVPFLRDNPFSALFIDMGMGKTVSSLTVIAECLEEFMYDKVLIIGPLRVATETWPTEIGLWQHTAWMNHSLIYIDDNDPRVKAVPAHARVAEKERLRQEAARASQSIHVVPTNWVEWLVQFHGPKWPYRCVFVDESSSFKSHKSGCFKALAKVRNTVKPRPLIERMHLMTATPAAESYEHLFAQIFLLDLGARFGKYITKFHEKYFTYNHWTRKWKIREGAEDEILGKIKDICLVLKAKDYLKLEEPLVVCRPVHLNDAQMALYRTMETESVVTLDNGAEIEAETAAALSSKLLQMASGVLYETVEVEIGEDEFKRENKVHKIHEHKIEELKQIVDEAQGANILVIYHFKSSLARLQKTFPKAVTMDREGKCVKPWNLGKIPMLLMHPKSGGHGLNLQAGGHHIVFFDLPWSLEQYLQVIGRLARQGQKHPVLVQLLTAAGTLDEMVYKALMDKQNAQDVFFAKLKRLIRKLRKKQRERQQAIKWLEEEGDPDEL